MFVVPHYFPHNVEPHLLHDVGQLVSDSYRAKGIAATPGRWPVPVECWYSPAAVLWTLHDGPTLTACLLGVAEIPGGLCGLAPWPVGLPCERTFDPAWRKVLAGRRAVEVGMFAGKPGAEGMMTLFKTAYEWARGVGEYLVADAHPRRRILYWRLMGMLEVAGTRTLAGSTAPAVLFGTDEAQAIRAGAAVLGAAPACVPGPQPATTAR